MPQPFPEQRRSIPACAGEPPRSNGGSHDLPVYPRVCGGTAVSSRAKRLRRGLSPRVRGNRSCIPCRSNPSRSIPACAGEPFPRMPFQCSRAVYPRVCGGTYAVLSGQQQVAGLSPRVRGNQGFVRVEPAGSGSIPACAGEPLKAGHVWVKKPVYPRVCGGTTTDIGDATWGGGLSPRVRGNLQGAVHRQAEKRSIPACAGEPRYRLRRQLRFQVYPRVCGGTALDQAIDGLICGLSPRVRGNPSPELPSRLSPWSIPACAGEPGCRSSKLRWPEVYPRVCGGTWPRFVEEVIDGGLSPRVRGNHVRRNPDSPQRRSIPACAGEPAMPRTTTRSSTVYPRVCGGTPLMALRVASAKGLSPRVRGNRPLDGPLRQSGRSIPACAGEPFARTVGRV